MKEANLIVSCLHHFVYLMKHKWYVFFECCRLGMFWQGLIHDWSKFRPDEFVPYSLYFFGRRQELMSATEGYFHETCNDTAFDVAWLKHQHRNPHHWQYWVQFELGATGNRMTLHRMPDKYVREMVCDWIGANKAQGFDGNVRKWFERNRGRMLLDKESEMMIWSMV